MTLLKNKYVIIFSLILFVIGLGFVGFSLDAKWIKFNLPNEIIKEKEVVKEVPKIYNCVVLVSNQEANKKVLELINSFRTEKGLSLLSMDQNLNNMAAHKAYEYSVHKEWSHTINGRSFDQIYNDCYSDKQIEKYGENLAKDYTNSDAMMKGWINSPTHYEVLTDPDFKYIGIYVGNSEIENYTVTTFIKAQ
jgi:uncharacterized protein YkwD